jgi:Domain of unknown function (DUF4136)
MKERLFHPLNTLILLVFFLLFPACAVPSLVVKINTSQDQQAKFAQYRTYNWYAPSPAAPGGPADYTNLAAHLRKAVEEEIAKKGLQKTTDKPQVLLAYDVSLPRAAGQGLAGQLGLRQDYGHANIANFQAVNAYPPGTILIDVIDASTRQLIWRGWAEEVLENYQADFKTVANYVDDIIDKYPGGQPPQP